jgi:hypothetical protein
MSIDPDIWIPKTGDGRKHMINPQRKNRGRQEEDLEMNKYESPSFYCNRQYQKTAPALMNSNVNKKI